MTTTTTSVMPSWNLRRLCEDRFLHEVIEPAKKIAGRDSWLVLIVDPKTLRLISSCMKMFDLMEHQVSVVENVLMNRQPLHGLDGVYFLTPTVESVKAFLEKDCDHPKNAMLYRRAHLFFTSKVEDSVFDLIKQSKNARSYVKTLVELNFDFVPQESRVFSTETPGALFQLYSPNAPNVDTYCRMLGEKIATLCVSLRTMPVVRYEAAGLSTAERNIPKIIGECLLQKLSQLKSAHALELDGPPLTLLLLGRTLDPVAPILSEFTYQAMAQHLLPIYRDHYTFTYNRQKKQAVLDDCDDLWPKLRHMHIADCIPQLVETFNSFMKANKAGKAAVEGMKSVSGLKDMAAVVRAMPEYFELLNKYVTHMTIMGDCMAACKSHQIMEMGAIEQDLATGYDAQGHEAKNIMSRLPPFLEDAHISVVDKVRLLMLFIISQDGMKDSDRERMMRYAKLPDEDQETISNLGYLGVKLTKKVIRDKQKQKKKKSAKSSEDVPDGMYELSRFVPRVKGILNHLVSGDLSESDFPFLDVSGSAATSGGDDKKKKKSLKAAPKWADKSKSSVMPGGGSGASTSQGEDYVGASDADPRFIVFIAGGMTYSEARSIYEVSVASSKNCYIGSTQFLTPPSFVFELNTLSKTADKAEAMEKEYIQKEEEAAKPKKKGEAEKTEEPAPKQPQ